MAREILGLFKSPETAAEAVDQLKKSGFGGDDYDILTSSPYPEEAFGEDRPNHRLFVFPIIGAIAGFAAGILITGGTQLSYPLVTGGKPLLSIPPMIIITYEGTMLGAIIFTILGTIFESRLPNFTGGAYDPRITQEGLIGVIAKGDDNRLSKAESAFKSANAVDVVREGAAARSRA